MEGRGAGVSANDLIKSLVGQGMQCLYPPLDLQMMAAAQAQASGAERQIRLMGAAQKQMLANNTLAPGIFWEKTRDNTHRVAIRREAEYFPDMSGLANVR